MIALMMALVLVQQPSLERRVAGVRDGTVRFSFAARPGVYGNGRNIISWDCRNGRCRNQQVNGGYYSDWDDDRMSACDSGPARVALLKTSGAVTDLRTYVGGEWRTPIGTGVTDLGTVSAREAAAYLLALAERDSGRAADYLQQLINQ